MPLEPNHNSADDECPNCRIYRTALLALLRKDMGELTITEDVLRDMRENGVSFDQVMKELEEVMGPIP
jgi:hypothetical protein